MQWTGWMSLTLGMVLVTTAIAGPPPPVIIDLGPVRPTPAPTPNQADRKRLITVITVQNSPAGETVMSFEATDFAKDLTGKTRTLASKTYQLAEDEKEKPELRKLRERITEQVRVLERQMLNYAEQAGPPKERAPIDPSQSRPR